MQFGISHCQYESSHDITWDSLTHWTGLELACCWCVVTVFLTERWPEPGLLWLCCQSCPEHPLCPELRPDLVSLHTATVTPTSHHQPTPTHNTRRTQSHHQQQPGLSWLINRVQPSWQDRNNYKSFSTFDPTLSVARLCGGFYLICEMWDVTELLAPSLHRSSGNHRWYKLLHSRFSGCKWVDLIWSDPSLNIIN